MFILKRKTPALLCFDEEEIETDLLIQNNLVGSSIDYKYAYQLGLPSVSPRVIHYTDNTFEVEERVCAKLKIKGKNGTVKTADVILSLVKHLRRDKTTIKIGREVISKLQIYLDYND